MPDTKVPETTTVELPSWLKFFSSVALIAGTFFLGWMLVAWAIRRRSMLTPTPGLTRVEVADGE